MNYKSKGNSPKIDGHVHLHTTRPCVRDISDSIDEFRSYAKSKGFEKIVGVFNEDELKYVGSYLNDEYIFPGNFPFHPLMDETDLSETRHLYKFGKIHHPLKTDQSTINDCIKKFVDAGCDKLQIHTGHDPSINSELLDVISKYTEEEDVMFYLVHGIDTLYWGWNKESSERDYLLYLLDNDFNTSPANWDKVIESTSRILQYKDNLLLGISPFYVKSYSDPEKLNIAVDHGLEDIMVYESDYGIIDDFEECDRIIKTVEESKASNEKLFYENIQKFLD